MPVPVWKSRKALKSGQRVPVNRALGQDLGPYLRRLGMVAALGGQHRQVAPGQVPVDPLVDAGELLGPAQRQDPPPAALGLAPTRPAAGAPPPCGTSSSASSGSSASPSAQVRSAAPGRRASGGARAISANSFRVIESVGAEPRQAPAQ